MLPGIIIGIVLVAGLAVYCWWQNRPMTPGALSRRAPLRPMMNLRKSMVCVAAGIVVVLCLGTVYFVKAYWPHRKAKATVIQPPAKLNASPAGAFLDKLPKEYNASPKAPPADLPPKGVPVTPASPNGVVHAATPPPTQPTTPALSREDVARLLAEERAKMQADQQAAIDKALAAAYADWTKRQASVAQATAQPVTTQGQTTPKAEDKPKKEWMWMAKKTDAKGQEQTPALTLEEQQALLKQATSQDIIKPANWAIPDQPLKTIYRSMRLTGRLLDNINSDIPASTIRIELTIPVFDKFHYDTVILDKGTIVIVKQVGKVDFGQTRIEITLEQIELPTGEVVFARGNVGDEAGAAGVPGKVNAHTGKLLAAAAINAIMYLGTNTLAGTPGRGEYYRSPTQDAAQQASQSVSEDVRSYTQRRLKVPPTIERNAQKDPFVTISLLDNIQFNRPPMVAR